MSDLISRQAAIKAVHYEFDDCLVWDESGECTADEVERILEELPSAEKKGKWEMKSDPYGWFDEIPVCSACGCTTKLREKYAYCPYCGAKMDVPDNDVGKKDEAEE